MNLAEAIQSENMDEIIDSMNAYAISVLKSVGVKDFNGKHPVDFVGDLLLKVMEGTRDWDKAECSFKEFLFWLFKKRYFKFFKTRKRLQFNWISPENPYKWSSYKLWREENQIDELLKQEGADDDELIVLNTGWMEYSNQQ